jgi:hypothetical protein
MRREREKKEDNWQKEGIYRELPTEKTTEIKDNKERDEEKGRTEEIIKERNKEKRK